MKAFVSNIALVSAVCSTKIRDIMHDISLHEIIYCGLSMKNKMKGKTIKLQEGMVLFPAPPFSQMLVFPPAFK